MRFMPFEKHIHYLLSDFLSLWTYVIRIRFFGLKSEYCMKFLAFWVNITRRVRTGTLSERDTSKVVECILAGGHTSCSSFEDLCELYLLTNTNIVQNMCRLHTVLVKICQARLFRTIEYNILMIKMWIHKYFGHNSSRKSTFH